jgi:hypothetical protein
MKIRVLTILTVGVVLWGCATPPQCKEQVGLGKGQPPALLDSYAASVIRPGGTWRIYLRAKDPDGDMRDIAAVVTQTGVAPYPTSFTRIREQDSKEVAGYLFLNTSARNTNHINDRLTMELMVRDCQGNKSAPVQFLLRFDFAAVEKTPEKWEKYAKRSLGAIMIDIQPSQPFRPFFGR